MSDVVKHADSDYGFDHVSKGLMANRINELLAAIAARDAEIEMLKKLLRKAINQLEEAVIS